MKTRTALFCILMCLSMLFSVVSAQSRSKTFQNDIGMELVYIPAGSFMMGSPLSDDLRNDDEYLREFTVNSAFYIGKCEVTQAQYEAVMGTNPSRFPGPDNPVEQVSYNDAVEFCKRLSRLTGDRYRLPTEAEWEYAARAGSTTRYYWGDETGAGTVTQYAWYGENSEDKPHPVGRLKCNAWGLFDMSGNVWERCSDVFSKHPNDPSAGVPKEKESVRIVARGGGWDSVPKDMRSAMRTGGPPDATFPTVGFRVVMEIQQVQK